MFKNDLLISFTANIKKLCGVPELSACTFHIALSGGLDSIVLLHLFARLREKESEVTLSAHHINHGLSENASSWSDFCRDICSGLSIDFSCLTVSLHKQNRTSLEALAREKRYARLQEGLSKNSYLVSAHHQDDQLETVLLALKRGSGNTGLQGIVSKQSLKNGYLIRPLLDFSRKQLEEYAEYYGLQWIEDESNRDEVFDRNYIRHTISPLLKARWPAIAKTVARSASICQEQQQILDEIAQIDFSQCVTYRLNQQILKIVALKALSPARRNNVLRYWFKDNGLKYPSYKQLLAVWNELVLAGENASPKIQFQDTYLRRYREHLYFYRERKDKNNQESISWQSESVINLLNGEIKLRLATSHQAEGALVVKHNAQVEICFRTNLPAKLTCSPIGRGGSRSIKKLLHEYHVPPWLRDTIPFILIDGELQEAVGLWQCPQVIPADVAYDYLTVKFG